MDDQRINELTTQWLNGNREAVSLEILDCPNPAIVAAKIVRKLCHTVHRSFEDADSFIRILEETNSKQTSPTLHLRVKCRHCDKGKPGRRTIAGHEEQCEFCGGTGKRRCGFPAE